MAFQNLSPLAKSLVTAFVHQDPSVSEKKIAVNPLVARVASWYEKLRNAMDYREDEVILRAAIERILKRRILLGGTGETIAEPLIRELAWARYFKDETLSESSIEIVSYQINFFLRLKERLLAGRLLKEGVINEWVLHLLSSSIEKILNRQKEKELMNNFMFHIMRQNIAIEEEDDQTKDAQVFIAVRRSFAKDDIAFLRYHLFAQFFGESFANQDVDTVSSEFLSAYKEIQRQLTYSRKEAVYAYIKRKTAAFFILEDIMRIYKGDLVAILESEEELKKAVFEACSARYSGIASKVRRAIIRSVIFLLFTKAFFAFTVEGTFESFFYGEVFWKSMFVNTTIPPILMVIVGLFIRMPRIDNSKRILAFTQTMLFDEDPRLGSSLAIQKVEENKRPYLTLVFTVLWLLASIASFGAIVLVLTKFNVTIISQGIFLFFLAIVSFLSYRIGLMASVYTVDEQQGWLTPVIDFFFMPIVRVGRHLTEGISQINILLFVFDFLIETPFKGLFAFFEQWFLFLHTKREGLE